MVTYCSNSGIDCKSSYVSVTSRSTMPWTRSCHVAASTRGLMSAVSMR